MKCPACSQEISSDAKFCQFCGVQLQFAATRKKNPDRPATSAAQLQPSIDHENITDCPKTKRCGRAGSSPGDVRLLGYGLTAYHSDANRFGHLGNGNPTAWWIGNHRNRCTLDWASDSLLVSTGDSALPAD